MDQKNRDNPLTPLSLTHSFSAFFCAPVENTCRVLYLTAQSISARVFLVLRFSRLEFSVIRLLFSGIQPEDGNCNVYRNVGQFLTFDAAYTRKPKFYT
jgi:hypothetical protein